MRLLTCIIEGDTYGDQFPHCEDAAGRFWRLDNRNDWFAKLGRKGEKLHLDEPPVEHDTLEVVHRYYQEALDALMPWLEYRFTPKIDLIEDLAARITPENRPDTNDVDFGPPVGREKW